MRYDEGGLKVTTTHLSRASIFPVYPALLVRGLIVITPYLQWIEFMDTNCMQIYHTMRCMKWRYNGQFLIKLYDRQCLFSTHVAVVVVCMHNLAYVSKNYDAYRIYENSFRP